MVHVYAGRSMDYKPLKRHPSLQPLSREHMSGLVQSRNLLAAAAGTRSDVTRVVRSFIEVWRLEIHDHFDDEERLLGALIDDASRHARLLDEHRRLRDYANRVCADPAGAERDLDLLRELGTLLHDHIRWEERELFEGVQHDHPRELEAMTGEAAAIEARRPAARARCQVEWQGDGRDLPPTSAK